MEKLVELLNEFEIEKGTRDYTWRIEKENKIWICGTQYTGAYIDDEETERIVISKKYKFIEWLVKNNKIDWDFNELKPIMLDPGCDLEEGLYGEEVDKVDMVLMFLSIQDNPLEFLIDILK